MLNNEWTIGIDIKMKQIKRVFLFYKPDVDKIFIMIDFIEITLHQMVKRKTDLQSPQLEMHSFVW